MATTISENGLLPDRCLFEGSRFFIIHEFTKIHEIQVFSGLVWDRFGLDLGKSSLNCPGQVLGKTQKRCVLVSNNKS